MDSAGACSPLHFAQYAGLSSDGVTRSMVGSRLVLVIWDGWQRPEFGEGRSRFRGGGRVGGDSRRGRISSLKGFEGLATSRGGEEPNAICAG